MKAFKYILMAAAVLTGTALTSCSDDDDYTIGQQSAGAYVYADFSSKTFLPSDELSFNIKVGRTTTDGALSVALSCDNDKFSAPSSVSFKDGEHDVVVPVTCDLELGETETVQFVIPTDASSVYGDDTLSLTISRDYTWEVIGTADFTDNFYSGLKATVEVAKAKEGTDLYKFVSPMTTLFYQNGEEDLPGATDLQFTMDSEGNVSIEEGMYDLETGTSLIGYYMYYFPSYYPSYCGITNEDGLITINSVWTDGSSLYTGAWIFNWNVGYPLATSSDGE